MFFSLLIGLIAHLPCATPTNYPPEVKYGLQFIFNKADEKVYGEQGGDLEHLHNTFKSYICTSITNQSFLVHITQSRKNAINSANFLAKKYRFGKKKEISSFTVLENLKNFYLNESTTHTEKDAELNSELNLVLVDTFEQLKNCVATYEEKIKALTVETTNNTISMLKGIYTQEMLNREKLLFDGPHKRKCVTDFNAYILNINILISTLFYCVVRDLSVINSTLLTDPSNFRSYFDKNRDYLDFEALQKVTAYNNNDYVETTKFPEVFHQLTEIFYRDSGKNLSELKKQLKRDLNDSDALLSGVKNLAEDFVRVYADIAVRYRQEIVLMLIFFDTKANEKALMTIGKRLDLHISHPDEYNHLFNEILQAYLITRCEVSN